jgi:redox-sensitive bicupin YhaK (pirin superfamily)
MMTIRKSDERGQANHGWLDARHSFSFADYYDPAWLGFRSLRVLNDDRIAPGGGFGMHPHRDMEIITFVLTGALAHQDSMGHGSIIQAGDFQYMSAGSGVRHSEFNASDRETVRLLQIWIQPDQQGAPPRYAEKSFRAAAPGQLHLVASRSGRAGSFEIRQDADLYLARLKPGDSIAHTLKPQRHAWVQVAEGEVTLNGQTLREGDSAAVSEERALTFQGKTAAQVLLFDLN